VSSSILGLSGICDVVEFIRDDDGVEIPELHGRFKIFPIEYKVGHKKAKDWDNVQLCAEVMALEESFGIKILKGAIFYGEEKRRAVIEITDDLRQKAVHLAEEMHYMLAAGKMPKIEFKPQCRRCSLFDICMPPNVRSQNVKEYINRCMEPL
jgi:CRISPR-associated exonuclease Cas4